MKPLNSGVPGMKAARILAKTDTRSNNKGHNILVTGGAGYIGSHACKALATSGINPIVLDNLVSGHRWAVRWGPLIEGDLNDRDLLAAVMKEYRISAVLHFAAYAYVGESMHTPGKYFHNNVANTLNLLDAMVVTGVEHIVFSSSCATYGMPHQLPIRETHPQHPISPYGESKYFVERMLHWYGLAHGIRSCILRYFNAAGDDPDGQIGEDHDPETHLIPLVIQTALGQRKQLKVFGTNYDTHDGTAIRDYIHVRDLADAHLMAVERLLDGGVNLSLNLGTGVGLSVRDIIAAVEHISGLEVYVENAERRPGDPAVLVADPGEAAETLGWTPRYSDLNTIVSTALNWHAKQGLHHTPTPGWEAIA
jgi:UDP-arabinose 4-epimerase